MLEELVFLKESMFDEQLMLVFSDTVGKRRFVEATTYIHFNLKPGQTIKGRIRSKGCAGNEIQELLHPYYEEGLIYTFLVTKVDKIHLNDNIIFSAEIEGIEKSKFRIRLETDNSLKAGQEVKCKLISQNKGRLQFRFTGF